MNKNRRHYWKAAACLAVLGASAAVNVHAGNGYAGPTLTPNSLDFGPVQVGTSSAPQTVSIEAGYGGGIASKGGTLSITSMTFPTGFARSGGTCPASGAAPNPCTIGVVFTPTLVGTQAGNAVITASVNGQIAGSSNLALAGNGVPGNLVGVPALDSLGLLALLGGLLASGLYFARRR